MSQFSEARRQLLQSEIRCPNPTCRAKNEPGKAPVIRIDIHNLAWCSICGEEFEAEKP